MDKPKKDSFRVNAEYLRKIIKENIWFGSKDEAFEFLDAMISDHDNLVRLFKERNQCLIEEKDEVLEANEYLRESCITPEDVKIMRFPFGEFVYKKTHLNLDFLQQLEQFLNQFKPIT